VDIEDRSKDASGPLLADVRAGDEQDETEVKLRDATRNFFGGMNNHSGAAKEMMRTLRVAVLDSQ
jgi:stearoyl-CoA desaturase (delta-9 desaturase)